MRATTQDHAKRRDRFASLYEANYHRILGYAIRRVGRDDAGDVVSETFVVAWRRLDEIPTGEDARLWLYGVARRLVANHQRSSRRRARLAEAIRSEAVGDARSVAPTAFLEGPAGAAFQALDPAERELLGLAAWEGLDSGAIAVVLGCSANAARIRLHRARRHFARELQLAGVDLESSRQPAAAGQAKELR